jgi:hypothetical protein
VVDTETKWEVADRLAKAFVQGVAEQVAQFDDCYGEAEVEEVETEARDGFIPYTNGGYDACVNAGMSLAWGSGHAPAEVARDIESSLRDAAEQFAKEHGITADEMNQWEADERARLAQPALPGMEPTYTHVEHPLRETLQEVEDSWLQEGGTYFYKVRVLFFESGNWLNDSGKDMVRLFAYLNTDYEYGRDNISWLPAMGGKADQTTDGLHVEMSLDEFIALGDEGVEALIDKAVAALDSL